jgi:glycosyltransferase involved in cell wall biosynthesis
VAAENLGHRIQFAGLVPDIEPEYQQADVFILPSRFEGYGMVFAEALSAGLPVIAAKAGAVPDVVPGTAGLLVAPDDPEALAEAVHKLLTTAGLRQQLQQGARACAAELPTWRDSAEKVCRRLREVSQA